MGIVRHLLYIRVDITILNAAQNVDVRKGAFMEILDQQKLNEILSAAGAQVMPVNVPMFTASQFRISVATNECILQFQRQRPVLISSPNHPETVEANQAEPVAIISMSPQALKDLLLLISQQVKGYEDVWGEIKTDYMKALEAKM
jgi:hypothetical protein